MWPVSRVSSLSFEMFCDWRQQAHGVMVWWVWLTAGLWKECSRNDGHVPVQGGARAWRKEGRKSSTKGGTDAATRHCLSSPVSSLMRLTNDTIMQSSIGGCQGSGGAGAQWSRVAMELCVMSQLPHTTLYKTWSAVSCGKVTWLSISFLLKLNLQWQGGQVVTCGHAVTCVNNGIIKQLFVFTLLEYLLHIIATYHND